MGRVIVPFTTALSLLVLAVMVLLLPLYIHPALDAAGAAERLGLTPVQAHELSDRTIGELLLGPGTFAFAGPDGGPFYDTSEAGHLRDVRLVLYGFLLLGGLGAALLVAALARHGREAETWRGVARGAFGLVVGIVVLGVVAAVAFDFAFELFHRLLFPGGNFSFDPQRQRLVQLYPLPFWQLTAAALAVLVVAGGLLTWAGARRRAARLGARTTVASGRG